MDKYPQKENVKITLFYSENSEISETKQSPALLSQGRANFSGRSKTSSLPPQQRELVSDYSGCGAWIRTKIFTSKGWCPTVRRPRNILFLYYPTVSLAHRLARWATPEGATAEGATAEGRPGND